MVRYLLIFAVLYPLCIFSIFFYQSSSVPLCGNQLHIFCSFLSMLQLSCVKESVMNIVGQLLVVPSIFLPLFFVLYSYLHIVLVCRRSSSEFRGKALQTCLPHIVTYVNFCISVFCEVPLSLNFSEVNTFVIVVLSLEFLIIPPINNPLVYGLKLPQIRRVIFGYVKIHIRQR